MFIHAIKVKQRLARVKTLRITGLPTYVTAQSFKKCFHTRVFGHPSADVSGQKFTLFQLTQRCRLMWADAKRREYELTFR